MKQQKGISLVELMIGMVIGLIILAGVLQVYLASTETNRTRAAMSAISENVRSALDHMSRELRMAASITFTPGSQTLAATLNNGESIDYRYDADEGELHFTNQDGDEAILVDGIADWRVDFGVVDGPDVIRYEAASASPTDTVVSARVGLKPEDPNRSGGAPLEIAALGEAMPMAMTVAMRNNVWQVKQADAYTNDDGNPSEENGEEGTQDDEDEGDTRPDDQEDVGDTDTDTDTDPNDTPQDPDGGSGEESSDPGGQNETVQCECVNEKNRGSNNYVVVDGESSSCTNECCADATDKPRGNGKTYQTYCPVQ